MKFPVVVYIVEKLQKYFYFFTSVVNASQVYAAPKPVKTRTFKTT